MYRTHTCGELRANHIGQQTTLSGWVKTVRKFGSITFVDLRDRYGITQLYFNEELTKTLDANPMGREFVIQVNGSVIERESKNPDLPTGDIEISVASFEVLNASATPPFTIEDETDGGDELRMQYRYLDLRRDINKKKLTLRYEISRALRNFMHEQGFLEIETPFLIKSTPEGARDFVVPSRMHENQFYALPQSPQLFKQLLMVGGYDKYYQMVKCFRDEDLRADRQPEFTQLDCEMSFVEQEDVLELFEQLYKHILKETKGINDQMPLQRMPFSEAMERYGNDKPDIRFGMELNTLPYGKGKEPSGFNVFDNAELVVAISAPNCATYTRKQLDALTDWVRRPQIGMNGLIYIKCNDDGTYKSSVDKFFDQTKLADIATKCDAKSGDLVLVLCGPTTLTRKAMSELRLHMGDTLDLRNPEEFKALWVTDFPLFEYDEDNDHWVARHHPFTSPKPEHTAWLSDQTKYGDILANAYDLVLNGNEIGGGSIRIHKKELQQQMFTALGMDEQEANDKFGFLLSAFEYGTPPHGGLAWGFDRLCAILGGSEIIRDFIAFPKNNAGRDVMLDAPAEIADKQKEELGLK